MIHHLSTDGKEIILVGTAHVSEESARLVEETIDTHQPDAVCVELCQSRYEAITQKDQWRNTNIFKVIKEKKSFLLLSHLLLAAFQKRIAQRLNIRPGEEMLRAIAAAERHGARIVLADRDIRTTLARTWKAMSLWDKLKLVAQLILSVGEADSLTAEDIEGLKQQDILESMLEDLGRSLPVVRRILIDERDRYLAHHIYHAKGQKIVAVVGAGHLAGILRYWGQPVDIKALETLPPRGRWLGVLKWLLPALIVGLIGSGFWQSRDTGSQMITMWIAANGVLAGVGALCALAHPVTIISSVLAAPLTSLNPMIAAGWVSGLVEAVTRKPKVRDLESLQEDIITVKGFWKNAVTRILLVVVFTNIGSAVGTFVAIPLMLKAM
jgi:pheromone shutdown-related protein TraB